MTDEDGADLAEPPAGSAWRQGWYCPGCGAELGNPGDTEPPTHCEGVPVAWEWMLTPLDPPRDGIAHNERNPMEGNTGQTIGAALSTALETTAIPTRPALVQGPVDIEERLRDVDKLALDEVADLQEWAMTHTGREADALLHSLDAAADEHERRMGSLRAIRGRLQEHLHVIASMEPLQAKTIPTR